MPDATCRKARSQAPRYRYGVSRDAGIAQLWLAAMHLRMERARLVAYRDQEREVCTAMDAGSGTIVVREVRQVFVDLRRGENCQTPDHAYPDENFFGR